MKYKYIIGGLFIALLWCSCVKEGRLDPANPNTPAPMQVSDIKVTPTPGGGILTYKLPIDVNLAYVKAVYEIQPGVFREAKSSKYTDTLSLVGFGDELVHPVKVYSVAANDKASEPVLVDVKPLTPPVKAVFSTINFKETFGGVNVSMTNPSRANLSIVILKDTTGNNNWVTVRTFYTAAIAGDFTARGFEAKPQKFAVCIRDRWNNKSDTLFKTLTPLYEIEIPWNTFRKLVLPTDQIDLAGPGNTIENLWNGNFAGDNFYASSNASTLPQSITIDLGKKVVLSRFKQFMRNGHLYISGGLKNFELYGSNAPNPDGSWASWTLLGNFTTLKPSGLPVGQTTTEDVSYGRDLGADFYFATQPPAVRYLRLKSLETFGSAGQVVIMEIKLFGQITP